MRALLTVLALLLSTPAAHAAGPWRGQVVDAETNQPLAGVVVLAIWDKISPSFIHPQRDFHDVDELVTDAEGRFVVPARSRHFLNPLVHLDGPRLDTSLDHSTITTQPLASAEILKLEPPKNLTTLFGYAHLNPPTVRRVLQSVSSADAQTASVDIAGVSFLGIRLTTLPTDPGLPPLPPYPNGYPYRWLRAQCQAFVPLSLR
jgi:hypothetical protein